MLTVSGLEKKFGGASALSACSFHVEPGVVTALVGPNGAGKTTVFDIVTGLVSADAGQVLLDGIDITSSATYRVARAGVSRTFQQVRLFRNLTLREHLDIAVVEHRWRIFSSTVRTYDAEYSLHLERFGIAASLDTKVCDLSYGQRKLFDVALAVKKPHSLLLLDEPVAGVNAVLQEHIEALLLALARAGETILVIEHDMAFVQHLARHVIVMDAGRVIASGVPNVVLKEPVVIEAYLGR